MSDGAPTLLDGTVPRMTDLQLATTDSTDSRFESVAPAWGIYLDGARVVEPDSIISIDYRREWTLADYPIEGGSFETYDKVARPFDVRLRIAKGGDDAARTAFMANVERVAESRDLYSVVTPEQTYLSVNVSSVANSRTAREGLGLVTYDLELREVRVTAVAAFVAVTSPDSADPVNGGTVQTQTITKPATQAEIKAAVAEARAGFDVNMFSTPAF